MFIIYLLRHGDIDVKKGTYYGVTDYNLSITGKIQMKKVAKKLVNEDIEYILTSPLQRAIQSGEIISKIIDKKMVVDHLLIEKSFGIFEGLTFEEIREQYPKEYSEWMENWYNYKMPEGESAKQLHLRCIQLKEKVFKNKKNVLLISHQGCIRYLISEMLSLPSESMWRFSIGNGKIAKLIVNDEGYAYLEV